eukprot:1375209-Amphidinium_carterae.2
MRLCRRATASPARCRRRSATRCRLPTWLIEGKFSWHERALQHPNNAYLSILNSRCPTAHFLQAPPSIQQVRQAHHPTLSAGTLISKDALQVQLKLKGYASSTLGILFATFLAYTKCANNQMLRSIAQWERLLSLAK